MSPTYEMRNNEFNWGGLKIKRTFEKNRRKYNLEEKKATSAIIPVTHYGSTNGQVKDGSFPSAEHRERHQSFWYRC